MTFLGSGSLAFSFPWELFLNKKSQDQKHMPQIILKERTAHLASYTFFARDADQYKNTSLWQLYQPPRISFSQNTYHELRSSCEYCKVFKNSFFIEHLQKHSFADVLHNRWHLSLATFVMWILQSFWAQHFIEHLPEAATRNVLWKHLCQSLIFSKGAGLRPATSLKRDSGTSVFLLILWNF